MSFRDVSIQLTDALTKDVKKSQGIFFTPKDARDRVFQILDSYSIHPKTILEPSFGSGEFLEDVYDRYPSANIVGVELNTQVFRESKRSNIKNIDFFSYTGRHELIIGNPPYFVIPKSADTELCQTGRPNIFVQFLFKAIRDNLEAGGYLAFVLPTSLFNCMYYEPMRKYLFENTTILAADVLTGKYIDTAQETFALVLRKEKRNDDYFVKIGDRIYLTPHYRELPLLLKGSTTLSALDYGVKTGDVVWNQVKEKLADTGSLLIYSGNFSTGSLVLGGLKEPKKQYIQGIGRIPLSGKSILINRGYGNTKYTMTAVIAEYPEYYAENHVNVIRPKTPKAAEQIEQVYSSLSDPRTAQFIKYFVGNGALSKSEIEECLPIWIN